MDGFLKVWHPFVNKTNLGCACTSLRYFADLRKFRAPAPDFDDRVILGFFLCEEAWYVDGYML